MFSAFVAGDEAKLLRPPKIASPFVVVIFFADPQQI